jgi:hypothetical protein
MNLHIVALILDLATIYNLMWGGVVPMCGDLCGYIWERMKGKEKPCQIY